jgi:predicted Zn finger-like uncharacterized protein
MTMIRMPDSNAEPTPSAAVLSDCPLCGTRLVVHRIITGFAGVEHWTLRCTRCGHIYQDAVSPAAQTNS